MEQNYKIYGENIEQEALDQFFDAMKNDFVVKGALMPDAHKGYSLPIGSVVATKGVVVPAWVGYDIGCGMYAWNTGIPWDENKSDELFDELKSTLIMGEGNHRKIPLSYNLGYIDRTTVVDDIMEKHNGMKQLGTLGGGNHFVEIGIDYLERIWIIVHSGSRGIGHKVATHYMELAKQKHGIDTTLFEKEFDSLERFKKLKEVDQEKYLEVKSSWIEDKVKKQNKSGGIEGHYGFDVESEDGKNYITDMNFCLEFALMNRTIIADDVVSCILNVFGESPWYQDHINRNHNHAEYKDGLWIHRKGATHAEDGMKGVIPGNMRDGSFIVRGLGNSDSLCSCSHGAGRVMSRNKVKENVTMERFTEEMEGIKAIVTDKTLDECPMAYKDIYKVMDLQKDLVDVLDHIKPVINLKG